jgi:PAS domain S-box-containing protein
MNATILLVDDNPQNLAALAKILQEHGYHIRTAINGPVALKAVQTSEPDLILLDIRMPNMDGYEVCRELKARPAAQAIPVLFLSALDHPEDKLKAFDAGGVDYITKPFQADEVVARVQTHLALRALHAQLQAQAARLQEQNTELTRYRDHLHELVQERTAELSRANRRLQAEIAEREQAEDALRLSEHQYRVLAEQVQDGIMIVRADALVFSNRAMAEILGQPAEPLSLSAFLALFPAPQRTRMQARLAQPDREPADPVWQVELTLADGRPRWIELLQTPILWASQPALLFTIRDITERKQRELRLEQERSRLQAENRTLKATLTDRYRFGALVGKSQAMQRVYELLVNAATSDVNVLICGESGTGKELIARTIHQVGLRRKQAFVPVNCASIPDSLFEREFFGHRKGAFTGADRDKPGFFDRAHRGVLFLDEVTELTSGAQAKLLRVLQDGEYTPLGSNTPKQADVMIVAATNTTYRTLLEQATLREDFFYRICVIEIRVPPLRDRREDIPLLIEHLFTQSHRKQQQSPGRRPSGLPADLSMLPNELLQALYAYQWPGNVRELQNVVKRYLATADLEQVLTHLAVAPPTGQPDTLRSAEGRSLPDTLKTIERRMIADALTRCRQQTSEAAALLGIPQSTLYRKIKQYGLIEKRVRAE